MFGGTYVNMKKTTRINIACGDSYVDGWLNFDYAPHSSAVAKTNLLGRLPLSDNEAEVVYSSHFFEHVPRSLVDSFLSECFRITKPRGRLRLVLPDFEEMCTTYLATRANGDHDKADFLTLEMLDQCVRMAPGGELGDFYAQLEASPTRHVEMIEFVRQRTGHTLQPVALYTGGRWARMLRNPARLLGRLERLYCGLVVGLLPIAFRRQNVSLADVGERHAWIYDFHSVEQLLKRVGFVNVERVTSSTSNIVDFPFYPLDVTKEGLPRKGLESMYIEAVKP